MVNTENKINKTDVTVGDESENKPMFINKENMLTESAERSDTGIQTDVMLASESNFGNFTESKIMNEVEIHSMPISISQNKKSDDGDMLKRLYSMVCSINSQFDVQNNKFDVQNNKFDEQNNKFDEQNYKFDAKFNELKGEMKQQNININEINEKVTESQKNSDDKCNKY